MRVSIPNKTDLVLETLILDLNGTIAVDGQIVTGVPERIKAVQDKGLRIFLFSGDTRGTAQGLAEQLGISFVRAGTGVEKRNAALDLQPETCIAFGNGLIDSQLCEAVCLSIVTLQAEGVHTRTLAAADIVVTSVLDAFDLLLDEQRLIATLRP